MHWNAPQCTALHWNAPQCTGMPRNAPHCDAMQCDAMQFNAMQCSYNAIQCYINVVLDPVGCHHGIHTGLWLLYHSVITLY